MKNNYETVAELLQKDEQKNIKPVKIPRVRATKVNKGKTKKSKKFIAGMVAIITAGAIAITSGVVVLVNHFKKKNADVPEKPNTSISTMNIDDMGTELKFEKENNTSKYGNTTGKVDINKIVEKDGKIYVDKESADKSKEVGKVTIDTKKDTLKVDKDGKVKEKDKGYEIKDDKGNVVEKGELNDSGIPDGYAWDSVLKKYLPKEEVGKYVYSDATYYDEEGNIALKKGDVVAKETLEKVKKYFKTTKPSKNEESSKEETSSKNETSSKEETSSKNETSSKEETSSTIDEGKVNADGTYTIFGLTFETKADYQQWVLQGYEGYAEADGIMKSEEEIQKQIQKVK